MHKVDGDVAVCHLLARQELPEWRQGVGRGTAGNGRNDEDELSFEFLLSVGIVGHRHAT
jgi:hypothetical protein